MYIHVGMYSSMHSVQSAASFLVTYYSVGMAEYKWYLTDWYDVFNNTQAWP